ncbi:MAG: glycosyltransferase family 2 protein [Candidatus Bathyarchaeia archaeon]
MVENGKIDLIMWTYNSAKLLPTVLQRINEVIPIELVNRRIISDDHSTDQTVEISWKLGWEVHVNKGMGLQDNKQNALSLVSTPVFACFEHDVLLSRDWWRKASEIMRDPHVGVVQGIRLSTEPRLRKLDSYEYARRSDKRSVDNNLCRTDVVRKFGFDESGSPGRMRQDGFRWAVMCDVVSDHITRANLVETVQHDMRIHMLSLPSYTISEKVGCFKIFVHSPIRALDVVRKTRTYSMLIFYPIDRLAIFFAYFTRDRKIE